MGFGQFAIGHGRGSSHGHSRIIRYTYPHLFPTQIMGDAYPLWTEIEERDGEDVLVRCGRLCGSCLHNASGNEAEQCV
jgi:hypothetical protein